MVNLAASLNPTACRVQFCLTSSRYVNQVIRAGPKCHFGKHSCFRMQLKCGDFFIPVNSVFSNRLLSVLISVIIVKNEHI